MPVFLRPKKKLLHKIVFPPAKNSVCKCRFKKIFYFDILLPGQENTKVLERVEWLSPF